MNHKLIVLPVALSLFFSLAQVNAASISFTLDQSNALPDGVDYAQVTISDSETTVGDIDFVIELQASVFTVSGNNFGMQDFFFNVDPMISLQADNIVDVLQPGWKIVQGKNAGGGFGKFDFKLFGKGSSRTENLSFSISGITDDTIYSYALGSTLSPGADEFFAMHIAGFDMIEGVSSAKFAGSSSAVPVPAALWLFVSGLIGLAALARRKV